MNKTPMYYFCENAEIKFIGSSDYLLLSDEERQKYRPATFMDVRLHGSDELKEELESIKEASRSHALLFGALK